MVDVLYRLRPLGRVLDELRTQTIFFASPDQLNDPTEGLRDLFWRGDRVVWTNLLKHYLVCLNVAYVLLAAAQENSPITWDALPILQYMGPDLAPGLRPLHAEFFASFFSDDVVDGVIGRLAARRTPVRRNELSALLRCLHMLAIATIHRRHQTRAPATMPTAMSVDLDMTVRQGIEAAKSTIEAADRLSAEHPGDEGALEAYFAAHNLLVSELDFINRYNRRIDPGLKNKAFVFLNFPREYVDQLESLVYPRWYAACFMADCRNTSVWGSYGQGHTGVCLKFKAHEQKGRPLIKLRRMNGLNNAGPTYGLMEHEFHKVGYASGLAAIDFFGSLGRLPIPTLKRHWYADEKGQRSACGEAIFNAESNWRERHWANFLSGVTRKEEAWSHEREYRLLLSGELDFSSDASRLVEYEFETLAGVVFGIKTPTEIREAIGRIIEAKCREAGRRDFKFYQAFYSRRTGAIEEGEMSLLKFGS